MTCKYCGSSKHIDNRCPTLNLTKYLLDEEIDPTIPLPTLIITDGQHLVDTIEEAHAAMHLKKVKFSEGLNGG